MSGKSVAPLTLALKPSRRLRGAVAGCYVLAAVASLANALPWWWRGLLFAAVLLGGVRAWCRLSGWALPGGWIAGWEHPPVTQLRIGETGAWQLWAGDGEAIGATLLPSSIAVSWFILLHLRDENGRFRAVPIMPDSLEADGFRRLAVRLRILPRHSG